MALTYIGSTSYAGATSVTLTAVNIGTASSDRLVVVFVSIRRSSTPARTLSSVTIGGNSATEVIKGSQDGTRGVACGIYSLLVTSGTTADIVVNASGAYSDGVVTVYTLTNLASNTAYHQASNGNTSASALSVSLNIPSDGVAIGGWGGCDGSNAPTSWTGLSTEDVDSVVGGLNWSTASQSGLSSETGRTITTTPSGRATNFLVAASWQENASGVSGTLASTDTADTTAVSGVLGYSGTLAATDTADTAALSGVLGVSGTLGPTEAADTAAFAGNVGGATGTLAATETADTAALSGVLGVSGTFDATEAADTAAVSGVLEYSGTLDAAEGADTTAVSGSVDAGGVTGALDATDAADTTAVSGVLGSSGTLDATETADATSATGTVIDPVTGTLAATEAADTTDVSGSVAVDITGTLAAVEAPDTARITGSTPVLDSAGSGNRLRRAGLDLAEALNARRKRRKDEDRAEEEAEEAPPKPQRKARAGATRPAPPVPPEVPTPPPAAPPAPRKARAKVAPQPAAPAPDPAELARLIAEEARREAEEAEEIATLLTLLTLADDDDEEDDVEEIDPAEWESLMADMGSGMPDLPPVVQPDPRIDALLQMVEQLLRVTAAPKRIIRDENGRPVGAEPIL